MNAPAPEAENEYSKGPASPRGRLRLSRRASWVIAALGLTGAALLLAAEFSPLYTVHVTTYGSRPSSVSTGSHDSYALIPIALLAAGLAVTCLRAPAAIVCWALGALGALALLIALLGDLPDTHAKGITHGLALASTTAASGLYLETLAAILLVAAGGAGVLAGSDTRRAPRRRGRAAPRRVGVGLDDRRSGESAS